MWTGLGNNTPNPKSHSETLTSKPIYKPPSPSLMTGRSSLPFLTRQRWLFWILVGALFVGVLVSLAYLSGLVGPSKKSNNLQGIGNPQAAGQTLYVDAAAADQPNTFRRVGDALLRARPGDRIVVRGAAVEETWAKIDRNRLPRNLVIEAQVAAGQHLPWHLPVNAPPSSSVIELTGADGLTFRNFVFDGQNSARYGIYLSARCPGVTFENCRVQRCSDSAIKLSNAVGEPERPITFRQVRVSAEKSNTAAVALFAHPKIDMMPANENIVLEDCLLEGPAGAILSIDGSVRNLVFRHNRLFNANFGLVLKQPKEGQWFEFQFQGNTLANIGHSALQFDGPPLPDSSGKLRSQIAIAQNLFVKCKDTCSTPNGAAPPAVVFKTNARDQQSGEGNCKIGAAAIDFQFGNANDPNAPDFLRYPKSAAPANLPDGPVGVPPTN